MQRVFCVLLYDSWDRLKSPPQNTEMDKWMKIDNFRQPATTKEACSHAQKFLIEIHQFSFTTRQQGRTNRVKFSKVLGTIHTPSTFKKKKRETLHDTQWIKNGANIKFCGLNHSHFSCSTKYISTVQIFFSVPF